MSTIRQMYCTHCTHGTSALERREGELAQRIFGYTVRAGSQEAGELRKTYRQVEPYIYYYLPRDTPSEESSGSRPAPPRGDSSSRPRPADCNSWDRCAIGRPIRKDGPAPISPTFCSRKKKTPKPAGPRVDCLRLWDAAGWVREDSPQIPFLLPSLGSFGQMHGEPEGIGDALCCDF